MTFGDNKVFIRLLSLGLTLGEKVEPECLALRSAGTRPGVPSLHRILVWRLGASISGIVFNYFHTKEKKKKNLNK